ncbi:MAG: sigma-70 family RNA polymerase sigma factor [Ruminococcus sp.]|nr:sigma-70 family RNA polymerase sigma factor [Ruminococcus sp.]
MLIRVQNESVEISNKLYEFLETDRRRQDAEERSDRRHLSKSSFEMVRLSKEYSSRAFEDAVFHRLDLEKMYEAMKLLTADEQKLIILYYWKNKSMQEIGECLGISKMAVSKRHQKILNKMRATVLKWIAI